MARYPLNSRTPGVKPKLYKIKALSVPLRFFILLAEGLQTWEASVFSVGELVMTALRRDPYP
ncbi:MAG: hypothetical protein EAZ65_06575 [Verrucomicrobia bacterium]|nr:MAG: hypothetical protein EAZ71_06030 [Verrucomicrobiota bacterium]TAF40989.1 MAG: hypothetical protein EAZ65_06575 [Verrucomicrobiota bacterium]